METSGLEPQKREGRKKETKVKLNITKQNTTKNMQPKLKYKILLSLYSEIQ